MMTSMILKRFAAVMVALALALGAFGVSGSIARAETGSTHASVSSSNELLLSLLEQLLDLLLELREQRGVDSMVGESEDDDTDEDSDGGIDNTCDEDGLSFLEVTVFEDETVVMLVLDGDKEMYVTSLEDKDDIIDDLKMRYDDLRTTDITDVMEFEEEDRNSRASDKDWDDSDSCGSDDDDNEDDDEDEDHDDDDDDDDDEDEDDEDDD